MREARLYARLEGGKVRCALCAHRCVIADGAAGLCGVRRNSGGILYAATYERVVSANPDPVEKKPLYHFKPGTWSMSVATVGCNFTCDFCQNHSISQWLKDKPGQSIPGGTLEASRIVAEARRHGCETISFTYTEPTVFYELARDTAEEALNFGIDAIFVTNGYMTPEMLDDFKPLLKAANVDLKAFSEETYRRVCGGSLQPVLDSIIKMHEQGIWLEITTLLIPGLNDGREELMQLAAFIAGVDRDIPWHISAFHPDYRMMDRGGTTLESLHSAWRIGQGSGLRYVYTGNIPGSGFESTRCPSCGAVVITRYGFNSKKSGLKGDRCATCGVKIPGVFQ